MDTYNDCSLGDGRDDGLAETDATGVSVPNANSKAFKARQLEIARRFGARFCHVAELGGYVDRRSLRSPVVIANVSAVRALFKRQEFGFPYRKGTATATWQLSEGWLFEHAMEAGFQTVDGIGFKVDGEAVFETSDGRVFINSWKQFAFDDAGGFSDCIMTPDGLGKWRPEDAPEEIFIDAVSVFLDMVDFLCNEDQATSTHIVDFIAHLIQKPDERVLHGIIMTSEHHGVGKNTLSRIVERLIGVDKTAFPSPGDLKSRFNDWLCGCLWVHVDEVMDGDNWQLANHVKAMITEPTIIINPKGVRAFRVDNRARFFVCSNSDVPFPIETQDRRWMVVRARSEKRPAFFYETVNKLICSDIAMRELWRFLKTRDLSGFKPFETPPLTEDKQALIEAGRSTLEEWIIAAWQSGRLADDLKGSGATVRETSESGLVGLVSFEHILEVLRENGFAKPSKMAIVAGLKAIGAEKVKVRTASGTNPVWRYAVPFCSSQDVPGEGLETDF